MKEAKKEAAEAILQQENVHTEHSSGMNSGPSIKRRLLLSCLGLWIPAAKDSAEVSGSQEVKAILEWHDVSLTGEFLTRAHLIFAVLLEDPKDPLVSVQVDHRLKLSCDIYVERFRQEAADRGSFQKSCQQSGGEKPVNLYHQLGSRD